MKTTLEVPDATFRRAKSLAASKGISLKQFFNEALEDKLHGTARGSKGSEPAWMKGFGALADLKQESARLMKLIDQEFEVIEQGDR